MGMGVQISNVIRSGFRSVALTSALALGCSAADGLSRTELNAMGGGGCHDGDERSCECVNGALGAQLCSAGGWGECLNCGGPRTDTSGPDDTGGEGEGGGGTGGTGEGTSTGNDGGDTGTGTGNTGGDTGAVTGDAAANISISELALFQTVKVGLMKGGSAVHSSNPIVAGKDALFRVSVAPLSGWQPRPVLAELAIDNGAGELVFTSRSLTISMASSESSLSSSLNVFVDGKHITESSRYRVTVKEVDGAAPRAGDTSGGVWPASGLSDLAAESANGPLQLMVVPFQYNGDGSGRMPDTSSAQIEAYRKAALAMYPVGEVEVTVRAAVGYSGGIDRGGSGWETWLNTLCNIKRQDGLDSRIYYWGIAAPASGWRSYGGGVAGLGTVPDRDYASGRCAVGVGFSDADDSGLIMVHEIGHTLGRLHAPCGTHDADRSYPYSGASTGVWGYDHRSRQLKSPSSYTDFMGYCDPQWTSDYTYRAIFDRVSYVNARFRVVDDPNAPPRSEYDTILIGLDGAVSWGYPQERQREPVGTPEAVELLGSDGKVLETVQGIFTAYSHGGGELLIPKTEAGVRYARPVGAPQLDVRQIPSLAELRANIGAPKFRVHQPASAR